MFNKNFEAVLIIQFFNGVDMLTNVTVADVFRPCKRAYAGFYDIALIIGGSLFIALSAQVKLHLPFSPVPVTGQKFAVLMIGVLLGSRRGCFAVLAYLIEGVAGLPVFAFGGGFAVLLGPTGGYLVGFVVAAYITGLLAERGWDRRVRKTILAMVFGNAAIYGFGLLWLSILTGVKEALVAGLYPFLVGDCLKIVLAALVLPAGWKLLNKMNHTAEQSK